MTLNVKRPVANANFEDIGKGECFIYNGDYFMVVYDVDRDEWQGANLATGDMRTFNDDEVVTALTATVSFKEID